MLHLGLATLILLHASAASARTLTSGPEVGWTRLADTVLLSASQLGLLIPVLGIALFGLAVASRAGLSLSTSVQMLIVGALVTLGPALFNITFGAEVMP